jgi:hypothetical protein
MQQSSYLTQISSSARLSNGPADSRLLPQHTAGAEFHVVHLRLFKDGARTVSIAGTFNDWKPGQTPLEHTRDAKCEVTLSLALGDTSTDSLLMINGRMIRSRVAASQIHSAERTPCSTSIITRRWKRLPGHRPRLTNSKGAKQEVSGRNQLLAVLELLTINTAPPKYQTKKWHAYPKKRGADEHRFGHAGPVKSGPAERIGRVRGLALE